MVGSEDGAMLWNFQSFKDSDNFHTMIVGCFCYVFLNLTETDRRKNTRLEQDSASVENHWLRANLFRLFPRHVRYCNHRSESTRGRDNLLHCG